MQKKKKNVNGKAAFLPLSYCLANEKLPSSWKKNNKAQHSHSILLKSYHTSVLKWMIQIHTIFFSGIAHITFELSYFIKHFKFCPSFYII